jgi:uncharacterized protein
MSSVAAQGALITVRAFGEAKVEPEIATAVFAVVTETANPSDALNLCAERMTKVIQTLQNSGVAPEDIRTANLNLMAQYTHKQGEPSVLRGYQVRNSAIVTVRKLSELGPLLRAGVDAGANQIGGISMKANDVDAALSGARRDAVKIAIAKAEDYARIVGRTIKALKSLDENPEAARGAVMGEMPRGADGISGGQLSVRVDVEGVFELA